MANRSNYYPRTLRLQSWEVQKFYEIVTGDKNAFKDLCYQLPKTIEKLIKQDKYLQVENDTVLEELKSKDKDILKALYKLAFLTYEGFNF